MATTYGYAGEFSSDEEIEKMEQAERLTQPKFDSYAQAKPSKEQIEDIIASIRTLPVDQDIVISDEHLAGLLDYYKTTRGPIVDSTRVLYKKIVLRLIRKDQPQAATNGDGSLNNNNNVSQIKHTVNEVSTSDEDEPMPPAEPMDIDPEVPLAQMRHPKQIDISSSESDSASETSEDESSGSEVLDVTPIKPPAQASESVAKSQEGTRKPVAASTPKEPSESKRKPYTRSQRVAATRASSTPKKSEAALNKSDSEVGTQTTSTPILSKLVLEELEKESIGNQGKDGDMVLGVTATHGRKLNYAEKMVLTAMIKKQQQAQAKNRRKSSDC